MHKKEKIDSWYRRIGRFLCEMRLNLSLDGCNTLYDSNPETTFGWVSTPYRRLHPILRNAMVSYNGAWFHCCPFPFEHRRANQCVSLSYGPGISIESVNLLSSSFPIHNPLTKPPLKAFKFPTIYHLPPKYL
jgi:hypothetical protein